MTIGTQDLELIKKEVAGIRESYQSRARLGYPAAAGRGQAAGQPGGQDSRPVAGWREAVDTGPLRRRRAPPGGLRQVHRPGPAGPGLCAEPAHRPAPRPLGAESSDAGRLAGQSQSGHGLHHRRGRRRAGGHPGGPRPLGRREPGDRRGPPVQHRPDAQQPLSDSPPAGRRELVSRLREHGREEHRPGHGPPDPYRLRTGGRGPLVLRPG